MQSDAKMPLMVKIINDVKSCFFCWYNDKRMKIAFLTTVLFGLFSYLYFFTNNLHSQDNVVNMPSGVGGTLTIGRWFLWVIDGVMERLVGDTYNIPVFLVALAIIMIGLSNCMIVKMLRVKSNFAVAMLSAVTVVYPAVASFVLYVFSSYYSIGIFFSVCGVYLVYRYKKFGIIPAVILFACSLGTYQAYFPFAAALFVLLMIIMCLDNETTFKTIAITGIKYLVSLAGGYVVYNIILTTINNMLGVTLSGYQGVDTMGVIQLSTLPTQLYTVYEQFFSLPFINVNELSTTNLIRFIYLLLYFVITVLFIKQLTIIAKDKKSRLKLVVLAMLIAVFPLAVNFIIIMVPNGGIHTLMQLPFVAVFYLAVVLAEGVIFNVKQSGYDLFNNKRLTIIVSMLVLVASINYSYVANGNFVKLHYSNTQAVNYYNSLFNRIQSTEGYHEGISTYIIGDYFGGFLSNPWEMTPFWYTGAYTDKSIYSREYYIHLELGLTYHQIDGTHPDYIAYSAQIAEMSTYPSDGSIAVFGDKLFVKMSE